MNSLSDKFIPISLTDSAIKEIKNIIEFKNIPKDYGLRIGIRGAGCSGVDYIIGFDKKGSFDDEYILEGIPLYIEKKHTMYVIGLTVDFKADGEERGFVFINAS